VFSGALVIDTLVTDNQSVVFHSALHKETRNAQKQDEKNFKRFYLVASPQ